MQTQTSQNQSDFRLIVLLAVAILICLQHIPDRKDTKAPQLMPVSWHDETDQEGRLYFDEITADTSADRYQGVPANLAPLFFQPIPINIAAPETLTIIPGIGNNLAQKIVDFRNQAGDIDGLSELLRIDGIGEKKAAVIIRYVSF